MQWPPPALSEKLAVDRDSLVFWCINDVEILNRVIKARASVINSLIVFIAGGTSKKTEIYLVTTDGFISRIFSAIKVLKYSFPESLGCVESAKYFNLFSSVKNPEVFT